LNESNKLVKLLKTTGVDSHSRPLSHTSLPVATALPVALVTNLARPQQRIQRLMDIPTQ